MTTSGKRPGPASGKIGPAFEPGYPAAALLYLRKVTQHDPFAQGAIHVIESTLDGSAGAGQAPEIRARMRAAVAAGDTAGAMREADNAVTLACAILGASSALCLMLKVHVYDLSPEARADLAGPVDRILALCGVRS